MQEIILPYDAILDIIDSYHGRRPDSDFVHIRIQDSKLEWAFLTPSKDGDVR